MSMGERLNAISVEHPSQQTREPPQADTLARLLTQGLQSQDNKLLNVIICQLRNNSWGLEYIWILPRVDPLCQIFYHER